jgi:hypothetical protein
MSRACPRRFACHRRVNACFLSPINRLKECIITGSRPIQWAPETLLRTPRSATCVFSLKKTSGTSRSRTLVLHCPYAVITAVIFVSLPGGPTDVQVRIRCAGEHHHGSRVYMLNGATQRSCTDPFDTASPAIPIGPHWMILWPFDAKAAGLSTVMR